MMRKVCVGTCVEPHTSPCPYHMMFGYHKWFGSANRCCSTSVCVVSMHSIEYSILHVGFDFEWILMAPIDIIVLREWASSMFELDEGGQKSSKLHTCIYCVQVCQNAWNKVRC